MPRPSRRSCRPSPASGAPPSVENRATKYAASGTSSAISRLRSAVPLQVNLKVKIAEVNRSLLKQIGVNLFSSDSTSGFQFGIGQGDGGPPTIDFSIFFPVLTGAGSVIGALFGYLLLPVWVFYILKDRTVLTGQFDRSLPAAW